MLSSLNALQNSKHAFIQDLRFPVKCFAERCKNPSYKIPFKFQAEQTQLFSVLWDHNMPEKSVLGIETSLSFRVRSSILFSYGRIRASVSTQQRAKIHRLWGCKHCSTPIMLRWIDADYHCWFKQCVDSMEQITLKIVAKLNKSGSVVCIDGNN